MKLLQKKQKNKTQERTSHLLAQNGFSNKDYLAKKERQKVLELITPNGVDPNHLSYLIIQDAGIDIYNCGLYISKLPRRMDIAVSFAALFNFEGVTSTVFINPLLDASIHTINKRINMLDGEMYGAERKGQSRNRVRELSGKLQNAEKWASLLDAGENTFFEVQFLFLLQARSLEELRIKVSDFEGVAKKKGFEIMACYGAQEEAFLSSLPLNRVFPVQYKNNKFLRKNPIKKHIMDKNSLSTIYNHTSRDFNHKNGVPVGRNMYTGLPICLDPFDPVHSSYGMLVAGMSGYGKSGTVKSLYSRLADFDYHICIIDYEPLPGRRVGETTPMVEACGGVSFTISSRGKNKINLYEVNEELEYDMDSDMEYRELYLHEKITDIVNILLTIATSITLAKKETEFKAETLVSIDAIIKQCVRELFDDKQIYDGDPDSLYENESVSGRFAAGRKKKRMPQQRDFYMKLLIHSSQNTNASQDVVYKLLLDVFEDTVEELYYCPMCLKEYTKEEYEALPSDGAGGHWCVHEDDKMEKVKRIHGAKAYFDTQSNIKMDLNLPCVSFDVSQVPDAERPLLMLICLNFIQENFIKLNSANPKLARKMIFSMDEAHRIFPFYEARQFADSLYRLARKRYVAPVLIMQSIADLAKYPDTADIIKNTETVLLFKHSYQDRKFIKDVLNITDSQIEMVLNLGGNVNAKEKRAGEFCLYEKPTQKAVFVHADYLKDSELSIVETDAEVIAKMYKGKGAL